MLEIDCSEQSNFKQVKGCMGFFAYAAFKFFRFNDTDTNFVKKTNIK